MTGIARARHFRLGGACLVSTPVATVCNGGYEAYWTYDANREFRKT